jgi:hypothetical protein
VPIVSGKKGTDLFTTPHHLKSFSLTLALRPARPAMLYSSPNYLLDSFGKSFISG